MIWKTITITISRI